MKAIKHKKDNIGIPMGILSRMDLVLEDKQNYTSVTEGISMRAAKRSLAFNSVLK